MVDEGLTAPGSSSIGAPCPVCSRDNSLVVAMLTTSAVLECNGEHIYRPKSSSNPSGASCLLLASMPLTSSAAATCWWKT